MVREYMARQQHVPADPAAREAAVQELIAVAREAPPVDLTERDYQVARPPLVPAAAPATVRIVVGRRPAE